MARWLNGTTTRHVRTLFDVGAVGTLTDGQLLERFTTRTGEPAELAFAALVERHGPMVLRVCRATLRDEDESQDAFQATFLVLVRKAGTLWVRDSLGPWLHTVASRVASSARSAGARRRRNERKGAEIKNERARWSDHEAGRDDLGPMLHQELDRLPERYRTAVVLCCLEGMAIEQAARQLGWPVGTVQSRLARGREQLRTRLIRRGLVPSVGAFGIVLAAEEATAALPGSLLEFTVQAAIRTAAGRVALAGAFPATGATLTEEVLRAMFLTKLKWTGAALLGAVVIASGVGVYGFQAPGDPVDRPRAERPAEPERPPISPTPPVLPAPAAAPRAPVPPRPPENSGVDIERIVKLARVAQQQEQLGDYEGAFQTAEQIERMVREWHSHLMDLRAKGFWRSGQLGPSVLREDPRRTPAYPVPATSPVPSQVAPPAVETPGAMEAFMKRQMLPPAPRADLTPSPNAPPGNQPFTSGTAGRSQEDRLREVERKLEQILKLLERSKPESHNPSTTPPTPF